MPSMQIELKVEAVLCLLPKAGQLQGSRLTERPPIITPGCDSCDV